jgi:regulation of enolase protein 1 (concanavalin A-like superfamily)
MTLRVDCPHCGQTLLLNDVRSSRSVRCPACKRAISTTNLGRSEGFASQPQPRRSAARPSEPERPAGRRTSGARSGASVVGLVLGILALVLGVPALAISWVPLLCVVGLILAVLGLLMGIAGTVTASRHQSDGLVVSLVGGTVSVLALLLALFMTFVSGAMIAALNDVAETDSADTTQAKTPQAAPAAGNPPAAGWGQVDPDRDCTITIQGTTLHVTVPPTGHDLSIETGQTNAPRVLQEVTGDFTVQVKVCGALQPRAAANLAGRVPFQSGGLLVWSDQGNYLRLERAALSRDGNVSSSALFEQRSNGIRTAAFMMDIADQDTYLRLERRGKAFSAFVSSDGQHWQPYRSLNAAFPARVQVGVAVINAAQQPLHMRFEGWQLDKK